MLLKLRYNLLALEADFGSPGVRAASLSPPTPQRPDPRSKTTSSEKPIGVEDCLAVGHCYSNANITEHHRYL